MLAKNQSFGAVQFHIEGVLAGAGHFIGSNPIVHLVVISLRGILVVHQRHGARPTTAVGAGQDLHTGALHNAAALQLTDGAFHPVRANLLDGNIGNGISVIIHTIFGNGLDTSADRSANHCVLQDVFRLCNFLSLCLHIDFRFLQVYLQRLNLHSVLQLISGSTVAVLFQILDLLFIVFDGRFHLLQFQPLLIQCKLKLLGVIGKQRLSLCYIVAFPHQKFINDHLVILADLGDVF